MANALFVPRCPALRGMMDVPATRGKIKPQHLMSIERQTLPTDPVGSATVTFQGVHSGSEIRVFLPDLTEAAGIESCAADQQLTWDVYSSGNANNSVMIRIIHSDYKIIELAYTSTPGTVVLPIQQQRDKWYSNPA